MVNIIILYLQSSIDLLTIELAFLFFYLQIFQFQLLKDQIILSFERSFGTIFLLFSCISLQLGKLQNLYNFNRINSYISTDTVYNKILIKKSIENCLHLDWLKHNHF